jgi:hypothetical protein
MLSAKKSSREKTQKIIRDVIVILAISFAIAILMYYFRRTFIKSKTADIPMAAISFTTLLFVLLLGFTVSDFWNRYLKIGEFIDDETGSLLLLTRVLKGYEGTGPILTAIREYCENVIDNEWQRFEKGLDSSDENEKRFDKIITEINTFIKNNPTSKISSDSLISLIPKKDRLKIAETLRNGNYVANLNTLCAAITFLAFLFINVSEGNVLSQIILDFGFISITSICLFMLYEFQKPFVSSFSHGYEDFEYVIRTTLTTKNA